MKWAIYILVGTLIALTPCVLYPEYLSVFTLWEEWDTAHGRPHVPYSGANLPPALRVVEPVFAALVLPPTWIAERVGAAKGVYSYLAAQYSGVGEFRGSFHYTPPALIAAGEYLVFGLPFWCIVVVASSETGLRLRKRKKPHN
jgi:hypothetical protein